MGECLIRFYREKVKQTWKIAFFSVMIIGLLVHLYKFTNTLPVADSLYNVYNSQNMVASGRWFLSIACCFSGYYDLPYLIGIFCLVIIGLTSVVLVEVFEMRNPCLIVLSSGLLVTFPAIWTTFGYIFTADGYMIAMLLAAVSVLLTKVEYINRKHWGRMVLSSVAICLSVGIYQAYISFAFILAVSYFILEVLENRHTTKQYIHWVIAQIIIYVSALVAYYVIWKLCLHLQGVAVTTYQGMDQIGKMEGFGPLTVVLRIFREFTEFLFEVHVITDTPTKWAVLNILAALALGIGLVAALIKSGSWKKLFHLALIGACVISIPFGCYAMILVSANTVEYHPLMLQSVSILYILTAVLYVRWMKISHCNIVLVILFAVVFNNGIMANTYYNILNQRYQHAHAAAAEVSTRIHMLDDGTVKKIAILGELDSYTIEDFHEIPELREVSVCNKLLRFALPMEMFLYTYTDFDLAYYRENNLEYPVVDFTEMQIPAPKSWECRFPLLSYEEKQELIKTGEVQAMAIWPHADSVQVIGDTVVIKLSQVWPDVE